MIDQLKKSLRGSCAYVLVSKMSTIEYLPMVNTKPVGRLGAAELIQVGFELFYPAAQIYGLAKKPSLDQKIRIRFAEFVRFAADVSCDPKGILEPEPLVDFRIDPDFGARPRSDAGIERRVEGFPAIGGGAEALRSLIGRPERGLQQPGKSRLAMNGPALRLHLLSLFRGSGVTGMP
jgi:hypothetical protein